MNKAPSAEAIKQWLLRTNPLGLFSKGDLSITDIDPKQWSGHFNYLVRISGKEFVLRFRGPEWGEPSGITREYRILETLAPFSVGPKVYYVSEDFFKEPMTLQEYLHGTPFTSLSERQQTPLFPAVARFIAQLNAMPDSPALTQCERKIGSYTSQKKVWHERLHEISRCPRTKEWGQKIETLLPRAEAMLALHEQTLRQYLTKNKPAFIFESAHAGHLFKLSRGFRFLNWEKIGRGDPSYTLAVFLSSLSDRPDFDVIKKRMARSYSTENPAPDFETLLEARLNERAVSNLIWVLWNHARSKDRRRPETTTNVTKRFGAVEALLVKIF